MATCILTAKREKHWNAYYALNHLILIGDWFQPTAGSDGLKARISLLLGKEDQLPVCTSWGGNAGVHLVHVPIVRKSCLHPILHPVLRPMWCFHSESFQRSACCCWFPFCTKGNFSSFCLAKREVTHLFHLAKIVAIFISCYLLS